MKKSKIDTNSLPNESWEDYVDRTADLAEEESKKIGWLTTEEVESRMAKLKHETLKKHVSKAA